MCICARESVHVCSVSYKIPKKFEKILNTAVFAGGTPTSAFSSLPVIQPTKVGAKNKGGLWIKEAH